MALDQKVVKIGETDFRIQTLPASKGIEAAVVLSHILAGAAEGVGDTIGSQFFDTSFNVGGLVAGLFKRLDVQGTPKFIKELTLESVILPNFKDDPDLYEITFAGNYEELVDLITAIIEHNGFTDLVKKKWRVIMGMLSEPDTKGESTP